MSWEEIIKEKDDYGDEPQSRKQIFFNQFDNIMDMMNRVAEKIDSTEDPKILLTLETIVPAMYDFEQLLARWTGYYLR
jgi:hypothetical protein